MKKGQNGKKRIKSDLYYAIDRCPKKPDKNGITLTENGNKKTSTLKIEQ